MTEKQESEASLKILQKKLSELESVNEQVISEKNDELIRLQSKISRLESERTEIITQSKIYEEKLKKVDLESKNQKSLEQKFNEEIDELTERHNEELNILESQNQELLDLIQQKEQDYFNSNNELLKLNALLEAKISMIEDDLRDSKEQKEAKDLEIKEIMKEIYKFKKENAQLQADKERDEKQYTDTIKKLNDKLEKESSKSPSQPKASLPRSITNPDLEQHAKAWAKEKELLEKQINIANARVDETRKINESLMSSFKNAEKTRTELQESNVTLTEALQRSDARNLKLEEKLQNVRLYKKIIESSTKIECKHCEVLIKPDDFPKHMTICPPPEVNPFEMQNQMAPLNMEIVGTTLKIDQDQGYEYLEYEIQIDYRECNWNVCK